jgi:hypothetical protein
VSFCERVETAMRLTSGSIQPTDGSRRCRTGRRRDGRGLASGGAVGSARELAGVGATMAAWFLRLEAGRGREREWRQLRRVVAVLKAPWTDRWGQGRRTVATMCPRVDEALWPVGHSPFSDETETSRTVPLVID